MENVIEIVSGEGTEPGTVEAYEGKITTRALRARLTREKAGGDRWAFLRFAGERYSYGAIDSALVKRIGALVAARNADRLEKMMETTDKRTVTLLFDPSPDSLGHLEGAEDVERYRKNLGELLENEFPGVRIAFVPGPSGVGTRTIDGNEEIDARLLAIETGDEWSKLLEKGRPRFVTVRIDSDYSRLGENATREDLEKYSENLVSILGNEFPDRQIHAIRSDNGRTTSDDSEIEARILEIERGDEWISLLPSEDAKSSADIAEEINQFIEKIDEIPMIEVICELKNLGIEYKKARIREKTAREAKGEKTA